MYVNRSYSEHIFFDHIKFGSKYPVIQDWNTISILKDSL